MTEVTDAIAGLAVPAVFLVAGPWYMVKSYKLIVDNDMFFRVLRLVLRGRG